MPLAIQTICALLLVTLLLAVARVPVGIYMYKCFTDKKHNAAEKVVYKLIGVNPDNEMRWTSYAIASVAFGVASVLVLWLIIMVQGMLPWGFGRSQDWHTALNTAVSFTTNTNWQSYSGETGAGYVVGMAGLTVQNFVSAATGIAVAVALFRGLARSNSGTVGNFWVDLVRASLRVLLPISVLGALLLIAGGVAQNLAAPLQVTTVTGQSQTILTGPVASEEAIKMLGTNGGGIFNANSAHPFENPNAWTNLLEILLVLLIPFSLPVTYGLFVKDRRQGLALTAAMAILWAGSAALLVWAESSMPATALEGKESRFGVLWSAIFATTTTGTSTGAVNSMHDSYSPLGGGLVMFNMMLGEVSPGGVGTGMYNMLTFVVLSVFIAGLMIGRTPEVLGKTIGRREITLAALAAIVMPALVLLLTAGAVLLPGVRESMNNTGSHGLSEVLYAYTSGANNNGSAFAGLSAGTPYLNLTIAFAMFVGRFAPIALMVALAGSLAAQRGRQDTAGSMPTHNATFTILLLCVILIVAGLTFLPSLALGPIAEALS
ncbi:potassium-transporting ATPase subunit KdpA [Corynebacterium fournieri]|uniref:potassium-transporting ATPase subunit KdpA n=1 Tax=Corynebacterium fournieri TaxID=1852390 RepID=UPI000A2EDA6C|nr:potassium-transporting ATPase subunit KdpA [Corynebacterium fournieri]WJY97467.1 Potassium-transporting ATPase A chain [Corynebacterium fournieri]